MAQKVEIFFAEYSYQLQEKINNLAKNYHIENISYSTCKSGYSTWHYACVLYTERE